MYLFTSKVEYALRAVVDLASRPGNGAIQSREIAARQGIPESYLDQLLSALRRAGLVRSIRGASGGYTLGKPAHLITVGRPHHFLEIVALLTALRWLPIHRWGGSPAPRRPAATGARRQPSWACADGSRRRCAR